LLIDIVRGIKSRRMGWAGHVASMWERRGLYSVLMGNPSGRDHMGDPGVDRNIILKWIFRRWEVGVWTGLIWLRIGTGGGLW
jgi:hypothetical protein